MFVTSGVEAPVRDIAARAGVGMGTIYRHFPTRADLIIAVYRHQVEACAEAGPALLATSATPHAALARWIDLFVDFLVTKHGLAAALQSDSAGFDTLHAYFLDRLVPVCAQLLDAAAAAGEIRSDVEAYELMRGVGNLCIGADNDPRYDARGWSDCSSPGSGTRIRPALIRCANRRPARSAGQSVGADDPWLAGQNGRVEPGEQLRRSDPLARRGQPQRGRPAVQAPVPRIDSRPRRDRPG